MDEAESVQAARTRARRRLIGAALLVGVGIIGFPLLFETQPRPIAVDIPIEMAPRDHLPPQKPTPQKGTVATPPRVAGPVVAEPVVEPTAEAALPASSAHPQHPLRRRCPHRPLGPPPRRPTARPRRSVPRPCSKASRSRRWPHPLALRRSRRPGASSFRPVPTPTPATLREARQKVEKLGLKTYTQVVETESGARTRVRVGPFDTRDEAEKAAARIKTSGLAANILSL